MKVIWSALAELRALEAVDYIALERPAGAEMWLDALLERVAKLDRLARRGRAVPEIGRPTHREIFHAPYRIIYRVEVAKIVILTLRHWHRSWDASEVDDGA